MRLYRNLNYDSKHEYRREYCDCALCTAECGVGLVVSTTQTVLSHSASASLHVPWSFTLAAVFAQLTGKQSVVLLVSLKAKAFTSPFAAIVLRAHVKVLPKPASTALFLISPYCVGILWYDGHPESGLVLLRTSGALDTGRIYETDWLRSSLKSFIMNLSRGKVCCDSIRRSGSSQSVK